MYGICHHGIREFVTHRFGETVWKTITERCDESSDIELRTLYPDEESANIMSAVVDMTGVEFEEFLTDFGEYWIEYTSESEYGNLMGFGTSDLFEILDRLNDVHERVKMFLPDLIPPQFEVEKFSDEAVKLHYRSSRPGLAPMVTGLIDGLSKKHQYPVTVEHTHQAAKGESHDIFLITKSKAIYESVVQPSAHELSI